MEMYNTTIERSVQRKAIQILGNKNLTLEDNFFEAGGDSLQMCSLLAGLYYDFGVELTIFDVYSCNTLRDICDLISQNKKTEKRADSVKEQDQRTLLSQEYMLKKDRKARKGGSLLGYDLVYKVTLPFEVDPNRLKEAFTEIYKAHDVLRCRYYLQDGKIYTHTEDVGYIPFKYSFEMKEYEDADLERIAAGIDVSQYPMIKLLLVEDVTEQTIILSANHSIFDYYSVRIFFEELFEYYEYGKKPNPQNWLEYLKKHHEKEKEKHLPFWEEYVRNRTPINSLGKMEEDFHTLKNRKKDQFGTASILIAYDMFLRLQMLCKRHRVSEFIFLLSSLFYYLSFESQSNDIIIGLNMNGRMNANDFQKIGMMTNQECIRLRCLDGIGRDEIIERVRDQYTQISKHQNISIGEIYALNADEADKGDMYEFFFNYKCEKDLSFDFMGEKVHAQEMNELYDFAPITFNVHQKLDCVQINIGYNCKIFDEISVRRIIDRYQRMLDQFMFGEEAQYGKVI